MFGIDAAFAPFVPLARCPMLILVPEVRPRPWAVGDRAEVRPVLRLCATFDHRIIDGAAAGRFAARLDDACSIRQSFSRSTIAAGARKAGRDFRQLHHPREARLGWDGVGSHRRIDDAPQARRAQAPAAARRRAARARALVHPRGPPRALPQPPAHRAHVRLRQGRHHVLHGDGAGARPEPHAAQEAGPGHGRHDPARGQPPHHRPDPRRARLRAQPHRRARRAARHHPPRRLAAQRHRLQRRHREADRLRPREGRALVDPDPGRHDQGQVQLHRAGVPQRASSTTASTSGRSA